MNKWQRQVKGAMVALLLMAFATAASAASTPVAKLDGIQGTVEYSSVADKWKRATRPKYLFPGYMVRTGADGSARILNQGSGQSQQIAANTEVRVTEGGVEIVRGQLAAAEESTGGFWQALVNKFSRAQRYTTVRRDVIEPCRVDTVANVTVSSQYPELVWMNAGPDCSYRLKVNNQVTEIPVSSTGEMIRFRLPEMAAGEHAFTVEVVQGSEVVYSQSKPSALRWLTAEETAKLAAEEQALRANSGFDEIQLAAFFEDKGLLVPAMDAYRAFMTNNPDENEMRPLLIKAYADLKLTDLRTKEATAYQAANDG